MGIMRTKSIELSLADTEDPEFPVLRRKRRDPPRSFRVPWSPWLPWLSALICLFLMVNLTLETWLRFLIWMAAGFVIYFIYGKAHSRMGRGVGLPAHDYSQVED